jgi:hypothetical protein
MPADGSVRVYVSVVKRDANYGSMLIDTNYVRLSGISSNSLLSMSPILEIVTIPVTNIERLTIEVDCSTHYKYTWSATAPAIIEGIPLSPLKERTTNNFVVLNRWYSLGQYKTRFTIQSGGHTNVYTQLGSLLAGPKLKMVDSSHLDVTITSSGSDTTIEVSNNLKDWRPFVTLDGLSDSEVNKQILVPNYLSRQFFRAKAH